MRAHVLLNLLNELGEKRYNARLAEYSIVIAKRNNLKYSPSQFTNICT